MVSDPPEVSQAQRAGEELQRGAYLDHPGGDGDRIEKMVEEEGWRVQRRTDTGGSWRQASPW